MSKRKYDDEALRAKALKLRKQGYRYREIARELGCSVYKVHEVLVPVEGVKSRIRQVAELADKVDKLRRRVEELSEEVIKLEGEISKARRAGRPQPPLAHLPQMLSVLCPRGRTR